MSGADEITVRSLAETLAANAGKLQVAIKIARRLVVVLEEAEARPPARVVDLDDYREMLAGGRHAR